MKQAMLIFAWNDYSVTEILRKDLLYSLSSVFVTAAFLQFLQSMFPFNMLFLTEIFLKYVHINMIGNKFF